MSIRTDPVTGRPRVDHRDADLPTVSWTVTRTLGLLQRSYNRFQRIIATQEQHTDQLRELADRLDRIEQKLDDLADRGSA